MGVRLLRASSSALCLTRSSCACSITGPTLSECRRDHQLENPQSRIGAVFTPGRQQYSSVARSNGRQKPGKPLQRDETGWPKAVPLGAIPSPYDILNVKQGAAYSKVTFYELVKLYHPDKVGHCDQKSQIASLPGSVKMERYRLIVAAHDLLSSPSKRKAYDNGGYGWGNRIERTSSPPWPNSRAGNKWSGFDRNDSPHSNATWEDWERWYRRQHAKRDGREDTQEYSNNGAFLTLLIAVIVVGAFGQSLRLDGYHSTFLEQLARKNSEASAYLNRQRSGPCDQAHKDGRIQNFLRTREMVRFNADHSGAAESRKVLAEHVSRRKLEDQLQLESGSSDG